MPALVLKSGPEAGKRFDIDGEVIVGRGEVDCRIDDAELSRRHLAVRVTDAGVEVEDLGSLNGTWLKGKRLEGPTVIDDGGVIRIGESELMVEVGAPAAAESKATVIAPVAPPPAADEPPPAAVADEPALPPEPAPAPEPDVVSEGPPPTNVPVKPRSRPKPPAAEAPEAAAEDASTVPPRPSKRRAVPPPAPSKSRRAPAPAGLAGGATSPHGAFAPPSKPGRRKVATRLVLPAMMTFLVIFATMIALIVYFATR